MSALQLALDIENTAVEKLPIFPSTRYQGSKRKLLETLHHVFKTIEFDSCLDLFSGTSTVALLLRWMGKTVYANDYLEYNYITSQLMLNATSSSFCNDQIYSHLKELLSPMKLTRNGYIQEKFENDFFTFDALPKHEMNAVYIPYVNMNNFFIDYFGSFNYQHSSTILVAKLLEFHTVDDTKIMYVHVAENHFEIIIIQNQKLLDSINELINKYSDKTKKTTRVKEWSFFTQIPCSYGLSAALN